MAAQQNSSTSLLQWTPSERWLDYFRRNAELTTDVPWELGVQLNDAERKAICTSIQEFQLGESSEGRHLIQCGIRHAVRECDLHYLPALRLFIAEEHRHARDLGRVLDLAGIPRAQNAWPDTVFRWLRRRAGLEMSICVLVMAEVIAKIYYAALAEATGSRVLRGLCERILRDEVEHVTFQSERVAFLRRHRRPIWVKLCAACQQGLFAGTCLVVWHKHSLAFRAGGFGFTKFWREAWREMSDSLGRMNPVRYPFPAASVGAGFQAEPFGSRPYAS